VGALQSRGESALCLALEKDGDGDDEHDEGQDGPVEQLRDEVVLALEEKLVAGEDEEDGVDRD
jgi:hypothetical protein